MAKDPFESRIRQTADGGFFATGYTYNIIGTPDLDRNAFWVKTDSLGIVDGCCMANATVVVEDVFPYAGRLYL